MACPFRRAENRQSPTATEGALIGRLLYHGLPKYWVIVSDDAGQFNVLIHALRWIHAERPPNSLIAPNEEKRSILEHVRNQVWDLYKDLKAYKISPDQPKKIELENRFDAIFDQQKGYPMLNLASKRLYENKAELLLVLERSDIPLHNNVSENDIHEYVKRRKISGSTPSELGRRSRNTFTSLNKTCQKWGGFLLELSSGSSLPRRHHASSAGTHRSIGKRPLMIFIDADVRSLPKIQFRISCHIKNAGCLLMPIPERFEILLEISTSCWDHTFFGGVGCSVDLK